MAGRKRVSAVNKVSIEDDFVSADQFNFELGVGSPKGRVTRSRRSSICLNKPPVQTKGRKRMSLMPVVEEKPKPVNRRKSMAVISKVAPKKVVSKGIELKNFYATPEKKVSKRRSVAPNLKLAPSPKKVIRKNAGISDFDIMESLDDMFDKTPTDGKRPAKTFETEAPEKTKPRRATIHLSSPMVAMSKEQMKKPKTSPVKQAAKTPAKVIKAKPPVKAKTPSKSPLKAKTPAKSPLKTKTPKKSEETPAKVTKKTPSKMTTKTPAKVTKKTPAKSSKKTPAAGRPRRTPAKSPKETRFETMLSDMQAVQVRLGKLNPKVTEDPNTIFSHLEVEPASPERISIVVEKILKARTPRNKTPAKSSLKRKGTESAEATKSKRARLESPKKTPKAKTPVAESKKTPKTAPRKVLIARKKTPGRPPAKRTPAVATKTVSTPAHVNPAKLLRRNLKGKVETAIVKKIAQKPDSSPYLLTGQSEKSPKFERVNEQNEQVEVKTHITGTPVQVSRAGRRFGAVIQPSLLAMESPVPQTSTVQSSTPLRAGKRHLLDSEATPIRAPKEREAPLSPAPEMFTGGLAKLCAIM